ncbi:MAG: hypothetical protein KC417_01840, partial [Myxococcales bacterium]|nr:hypothetical protein [Myxococcales bacterium]
MGAAARPSDWFAWVLLVSFAATNGVTGQATAEPPVDGDPLATDGTDDLANVRVPAPRPPKPRETALLTARPGVRVVDHGVTVDADAFAITFTETLLVENTGAFASDFVYRIPMSGDLAAGVATDDGRVQRRTTTRAGEATADAPERLEITSAALSPGERRTITIAYAAQTSVRDGVLRVRIPPRPADDRDPNLKWASRLGTAWTDAAIDGVPLGRAPSAEGVALWPRFGLELSVKLRRRLASSAGGCTAGGVPHRVVALATPVERPVVARVMLLIDASPSMEGTAQNRVPSTLTALLGRAPVGTWFRPVVFRSTAVPVLDRPFVRAEAVTLGAVEDAAGRATGSATAPDAAWRT